MKKFMNSTETMLRESLSGFAQCHWPGRRLRRQNRCGAFGSGASGSSIIRTRLFVPSGTPFQASGGEISTPSQVYFDGI